MTGDSRKTAEPEELRDWCIHVLDFISAAARMTAEEVSPLKKNIWVAGDTSNVRGLRMVERDLSSWAKELDPEDQVRLDAELVEKFGRGLGVVQEQRLREVRKILKRGSIVDAEEARLLISRADEIHEDEARGAELGRIEELLGSFEDVEDSP